MDWIADEMKNNRLPDKRLTNRLSNVLRQLSQTPDESVPANCQTWSETLAAYRFFDNDRIDAHDILSGHAHATGERIAAQAVALLVQDTTQLNYVVEGEKLFEQGTLHRTEKDSYWLHPTVAFTPERVNLGIVHHEFWQRPDARQGETRKRRDIPDKESMRWLRGYEIACAVQARCPATCVISVADREGDIYDCFKAVPEQTSAVRAEVIIRANANRRLDTDDVVPGIGSAPYLLSTCTRSMRAR